MTENTETNVPVLQASVAAMPSAPVGGGSGEMAAWKESFKQVFDLLNEVHGGQSVDTKLAEFCAEFAESNDTAVRDVEDGTCLDVVRIRYGYQFAINTRYGNVDDFEQANKLWLEHCGDKGARHNSKFADDNDDTPDGVLVAAGIKWFSIPNLKSVEGERVFGAAQNQVGKYVRVYREVVSGTTAKGKAFKLRTARHVERVNVDLDTINTVAWPEDSVEEAEEVTVEDALRTQLEGVVDLASLEQAVTKAGQDEDEIYSTAKKLGLKVSGLESEANAKKVFAAIVGL